MATSTETKIRQQIDNNPILLYMKGTPDNPECGFSRSAVEAIKTTGFAFNYVNVLATPFIREKLPAISNWPTYPQLFVNGELIGGCDILVEMAENKTLIPLLKAATTTQTSEDALKNQEVIELIRGAVPDAHVEIDGENCNFSVTVISAAFSGIRTIARQQRVLAPFHKRLKDGDIHALSVNTYTPEEWQQKCEKDRLIHIDIS